MMIGTLDMINQKPPRDSHRGKLHKFWHSILKGRHFQKHIHPFPRHESNLEISRRKISFAFLKLDWKKLNIKIFMEGMMKINHHFF